MPTNARIPAPQLAHIAISNGAREQQRNVGKVDIDDPPSEIPPRVAFYAGDRYN